MTLPLRELGKTGVKISVIGLGCMGMSEFYGSSDEQENIKVLNRALELGCNFWDTSDAYGCGANEILISKILKDRVSNVSGKPEYARQACENSLKRLEIDCIDLYYQHRVDPETPIEDTVGALAELVKEGKIKYIGLSECFAATLRRAHKIHPISAVQDSTFGQSFRNETQVESRKSGQNPKLGLEEIIDIFIAVFSLVTATLIFWKLM
ncbi:unnamed protein product [Rhizophagus irregularis]|nr:unnamed protein product [Rhizophagus irregularis]